MPQLDLLTGLKECSKCHEKLHPKFFYDNPRGYGDGKMSRCIECTKAAAIKSMQKRNGPARKPYIEDEVWIADWIERFCVAPRDMREGFEDPSAYSDGSINSESLAILLKTWTGSCPRCHTKTRPVTHYADLKDEHDQPFSRTCCKLLCSQCSWSLHNPEERSWSGLK